MSSFKKIIVRLISAGMIYALLTSVILFGGASSPAEGLTDGAGSLSGKNWMSCISDDRYIYEINLPGTHDSTTAFSKNSTGNSVSLFGIPVFDSGKYAKTQSYTLTEQLNSGVRYLDLRFSAEGGKLLLCHGNADKAAPVNKAIKALSFFNPLMILLNHFNIPFLSLDIVFYAYEDENCSVNITCDSALAQIKNFLKENPTETVIVTAKKENGDKEEFLKLFIEQINELKTEINPSTQKEYLYSENGRGIYSKMPLLSDVRGKIILMTPFYQELNAGDMLDAQNKSGQTDFMGKTFNYENHWSVTGNIKALYIKRFIETYSAEMSRDPKKHSDIANVIKTNSSAVLLQTPGEIEKRVSDALYSRGKLVKGRYYGWIMGDFMTEEKCREIWQTNYFVFDE